MTTLQMAMVERHPGGRLVFNVRVQSDGIKLEFPNSKTMREPKKRIKPQLSDPR